MHETEIAREGGQKESGFRDDLEKAEKRKSMRQRVTDFILDTA